MEKIEEVKSISLVKVEKVSVRETLKNMQVGETRSVKHEQIKMASLRGAVNYLRQYGYDYELTERGRKDDSLITCKKKPYESNK